jgi:hypothetical protein
MTFHHKILKSVRAWSGFPYLPNWFNPTFFQPQEKKSNTNDDKRPPPQRVRRRSDDSGNVSEAQSTMAAQTSWIAFPARSRV